MSERLTGVFEDMAHCHSTVGTRPHTRKKGPQEWQARHRSNKPEYKSRCRNDLYRSPPNAQCRGPSHVLATQTPNDGRAGSGMHGGSPEYTCKLLTVEAYSLAMAPAPDNDMQPSSNHTLARIFYDKAESSEISGKHAQKNNARNTMTVGIRGR